MNIHDLLNKDIDCSCGRTHRCDIGFLKIGENALDTLPEAVKNYKSILLVADNNTYPLCYDRVKELIGDKITSICLYQTESHLVPDETAIEKTEKSLCADTDLILGIGSGVINDICKYVSFYHGIKSGIIATAPSMDGYASSGAAMITDGMKVTYTTHAPDIIIGDTEILRNAPIEMIRSGYGDIIGKYSSLNDWKLANLVRGEHLCPFIYDLVLETTNDIRDSASAIVARDSRAIEKLMSALVLIGMTLTLVKTTRPGSGSEHHLSHFFEIVGLVKGESHLPHGTDVAYNTIITAAIREKIRELDNPVFFEESEADRFKAWERIYGKVSDEVKELQKKAGRYDSDMKPVYIEKWAEIREILLECSTAAECDEMMREVGFDLSECIETYGHEKLCDAIKYGKDLKDRYSVLWLYYVLFSGKTQEENFDREGKYVIRF